MSKKKMSLHYTPAVLKESSYRWYILYYQFHPILNKKVRFRETYDLNRIKDLKLRRMKAMRVVNQINERLPYGWPYEDLDTPQNEILLFDALDIALERKMTSDSLDTRNSYSSMVSIFKKYCLDKDWQKMPLYGFTKVHAMNFLHDSLVKRKLAAVTYNNYINTVKAVFSELVVLEYIQDNPFSKIKKRKVGAKQRRAFSDHERSVMIDYVAGNDKWLHLGILLQYYCFIRPNELRFLKPYMFDFDQSLIRIPGTISKNDDDEIVTIPNVVKDIFRDVISNIASNYYIFGSRFIPNPNATCSKNYMNERHRKILQHLHGVGKLDHIDGLTYYSWKDTGAMQLFRDRVPATEIMRQMRHKDLSYTQRYCQSLYIVNKEIKGLDNHI